MVSLTHTTGAANNEHRRLLIGLLLTFDVHGLVKAFGAVWAIVKRWGYCIGAIWKMKNRSGVTFIHWKSFQYNTVGLRNGSRLNPRVWGQPGPTFIFGLRSAYVWRKEAKSISTICGSDFPLAKLINAYRMPRSTLPFTESATCCSSAVRLTTAWLWPL